MLTEAKSLVSQLGIIPALCIVPFAASAYAIETFATEPLVDAWYADTSVAKQFRGLRLGALALAQVWTFLTSGYGVI